MKVSFTVVAVTVSEFQLAGQLNLRDPQERDAKTRKSPSTGSGLWQLITKYLPPKATVLPAQG